MKIVTYNVNKDCKALDYKNHWSQVIAAFDPDVFLAQESRHPKDCGLSQHLLEQAIWRPVLHDYGTAVYAKNGRVTELAVDDHRGMLAGVEIVGCNHPGNAKRLLAFSLHAPTDENTIAALDRMLTSIASIISKAQDADVVIGGDFNVNSLGERHESEVKDGKPWVTTKSEKTLLDRLRDKLGLMNCWQTAHPNTPLSQTCRWNRNPIPAYHCDGIFVPSSWEPALQSCEVITPEIWRERGNGLSLPRSDHNPVIATFAE